MSLNGMEDSMKRFVKRSRGYIATAGIAMLLLLILPLPFVTGVAAESENTNLMQQIFAAVQRIETAVTGLSGVNGSLSGLQSDVTAIKTKTDALPANTAAALTEIKANIGYGPLTHIFMDSFLVHSSQTDSITCISSGPYLAFVQARGIDADVTASLNGSSVMSNNSLPVPTTLTLGGNPGDALTIELIVGSQVNPNAYALGLVTIQTTEGSVIGCN